MTIQECYEKLGGNYNEMFARLKSEAFVERFALKFLSDDSFNQLKTALDNDDTQTAFRSAHTLKGVCANLSFTELFKVSYDITEMLRSGNTKDAKNYFPAVQDKYDFVIKVLNEFKGN